MNMESKRIRYVFLDNLKLFFTILVIFWHTMNTYAEVGWWYYKETNSIDLFSDIFFLLLTSIGGVFQSSLLGLFFLLGGYFTPKSYDRKGFHRFWKERLIRLGIPLLLYIALINPIIIYTLSLLRIPPWSTNPMLQGTFLDYYLSRFLSWKNFVDFFTFAGPMWFLLILLIFTVVYTLWRQITKFNSLQGIIPKELYIPRYIYLLLLAIGLGFFTFLVRIVFLIDYRPLGIPWGQLTQYLMMFIFGVICVRYKWFEKMSKKYVNIWLITIIASVALIYIDFFIVLVMDGNFIEFSGGLNLHALLFALVDNIICMGVIFVLIKVFYEKFNNQGSKLRNLSASAYHMYIVHPFILVSISIVFASLELYPIVKLAIVFPLTIFFGYLLSHFVLKKVDFRKSTNY